MQHHANCAYLSQERILSLGTNRLKSVLENRRCGSPNGGVLHFSFIMISRLETFCFISIFSNILFPISRRSHRLITFCFKINISFLFLFVISGVFRGGHEVLLRAKLALAEGVTMQLTVRTTNSDIAELVTSAIG